MKKALPHQQAQEAAAQTAKEWVTIFDAIADLVSLHDMDFRLIRVNKAFAAALKKRPEDLVGRKCYAVIHGSKKPPKNCPHSKVLQTESPAQMEFFEPHLGCTLDVSASPIFDQSGKLTGSVHIAKDITAHRRAEEALAAEKEWLAVTLKSIGDGVIATDTDGHVIRLNSVAESLTGWSQEEAGGKPFRKVFNIINEETGKVCENPIGKVLEKGTIVGLANHTALIARDGTQRSIADSAAPIRDRYGKTIGVVLVFRDITEQKRVQEALRESEELHRTLFEQAKDTILILDLMPDGMPVIMDANVTALRMHGYSREEIIGKPISKLDAEDSPALVKERLCMIRSSEGKIFKAKHRRKDGSVFDVEVSAIEMVTGGRRRIVDISRDITERKEMENQLAAVEKITTMSHFVAGAAHEINNPLAAVISFCETIQCELKSVPADVGKLRESVGVVLRNAVRCESIVASLMSYGRAQMSQSVPVDINELIEKALSLDEYFHSLKKIDIQRHCPTGIPLIMGNKEQLVQAFTNIIRNAIQAMQGEGVLEIDIKTDGNNVCIVFTDSGVGIAPDNLSKIFDLFFTTREVGQGTGLGLAVSAGIIRAHNGKISAASKGKGMGASFKVILPIPMEDVKHV